MGHSNRAMADSDRLGHGIYSAWHRDDIIKENMREKYRKATGKCGAVAERHTALALSAFKVLTAFAVFFILIFFPMSYSAKTYAAETDRKIRVGYYTLSNFQEYDGDTGQYSGYSYDYLMAVAQYAGWEYEFVPVTYDQGISMLENGEIDIMNGVTQSDSLSHRLLFSSLASGESCTCLVVAPDNTDVSYEDFSTFEKLTVGLDYSSTMNSGFVDYCKDNDCLPKLIYYHTVDGVTAGLKSGEIDAYIISNLQDVNMRTVAKFDAKDFYFVTSKSNTELMQELNKAVNELKTTDPYFEENIYAKYHTKSAGQQTVISEEEKEYISQDNIVKVAYDPEWYPISYTDEDGRFSGAMASILSLISKNTGLRFEYVPSGSYEEALDSFRNGDAQIMAGFPYDFTWAEKNNAYITSPFEDMTVFEAYSTGKAPGNVIAAENDSYQQYLLSEVRNEPYAFKYFDSTGECMQALLDGKADYALVDSYQMEYYRDRAKYQDLSYKVANGQKYSLCIAVSEDSDEKLYSIMRKAIVSIGTDEISSIFKETSINSKSSSIPDLIYEHPQVAGWFFSILGFVVAFVIFVMIYTRRMQKKNAQLAAATNAKSEFLSNMSHDMRTPLNGILGYTNMAKSAETPGDVSEYLNKIEISGKLLLGLINDTLDISKIESGKFTLHPEPVDIDELLDSIIVPIQQRAQDKNILFTVDRSRMKRGYVNVDRLNIQKVILNLLSNAIKFTPDKGKVELDIVYDPSLNDPCNTMISVIDNGIGISEEFMPKMFDPFTQESAPGTGKTVGTGLGLSIVKEVVTLMEGNINVKSNSGKGTRFDVLLPLDYLEDYTPRIKDVSKEKDVIAGMKVLLCEDNYMNRDIAVNILENYGVKVHWEPDGKKGLEAFQISSEGEYDAVLMDLRMPVLDGFTAAMEIRMTHRSDAASVPIIAISADTFDDDIQRCRKCGMNGHIAKPFNSDDILKTLAEYCRKAGDTDEK